RGARAQGRLGLPALHVRPAGRKPGFRFMRAPAKMASASARAGRGATGMSVELYLAFVLACAVITIVPGPTVTLIVANSLRYGTRAGLLNVVGTQLGLGVMLAILVIGLASIIETMGWWFDWLRLLGAAYLVWLGWKLLRSPAQVDAPGAVGTPRGGFVLQGFLVLMGNPKALLWFGAFIPQFID